MIQGTDSHLKNLIFFIDTASLTNIHLSSDLRINFNNDNKRGISTPSRLTGVLSPQDVLAVLHEGRASNLDLKNCVQMSDGSTVWQDYDVSK